MSLGPVFEARSDVSSDVTTSSTERFLKKGIKSSQHQIPDITLCLRAPHLKGKLNNNRRKMQLR